MDLPPRVAAIINSLWAQHRELAAGDADAQRELTRMIAEQCAFELGPQWGTKSATPDRPQGPSEIAFNQPPLYIWRWSDGDGHVTGIIGAPLPQPLLIPLDQTQGQYFRQVDPIDHLHVRDTRPPATPPPPALDLRAILDRLEKLEATIAGFDPIGNELMLLKQQIANLLNELEEVRHQRYVAAKWGVTIVSIPEADAARAALRQPPTGR